MRQPFDEVRVFHLPAVASLLPMLSYHLAALCCLHSLHRLHRHSSGKTGLLYVSSTFYGMFLMVARSEEGIGAQGNEVGDAKEVPLVSAGLGCSPKLS